MKFKTLWLSVLVTYPLNHSRRIYSPKLNFMVIQKKKIKFVRAVVIDNNKINLEDLELIRPWGPQSKLTRAPQV